MIIHYDGKIITGKSGDPILGDDDEKSDPILGESSSLSCDGALVSSAAPA